MDEWRMVVARENGRISGFVSLLSLAAAALFNKKAQGEFRSHIKDMRKVRVKLKFWGSVDGA